MSVRKIAVIQSLCGYFLSNDVKQGGIGIKKGRRKIAIIIVLGFSILLLLIGFSMLIIMDEKKAQDAAQPDYGVGVLDRLPKEELLLAQDQNATREWSNDDDVLEGDAVPENYAGETTNDEDVDLFQMGTPTDAKSRLISLCEEYNELIPYGYQGRSWSYGYFKQEDGYENILYDSCASGLGVDGLGYVIWLYRNSLGHTPAELMGVFDFSHFTKKISLNDVQIGDFCVTTDKYEDVCYGIVCGFSPDGHVIVTMCDNSPSDRFPYGCNHLVYVKDDCNSFLGNYAAVDFKIFYRLQDLM